MRWLVWFANVLLLATTLAMAAHSHEGLAQERSCAVCTLAQAPSTLAPAAPAALPPAPTSEVVLDTPVLRFASALCAIPPSRGPPLG